MPTSKSKRSKNKRNRHKRTSDFVDGQTLETALKQVQAVDVDIPKSLHAFSQAIEDMAVLTVKLVIYEDNLQWFHYTNPSFPLLYEKFLNADRELTEEEVTSAWQTFIRIMAQMIAKRITIPPEIRTMPFDAQTEWVVAAHFKDEKNRVKLDDDGLYRMPDYLSAL